MSALPKFKHPSPPSSEYATPILFSKFGVGVLTVLLLLLLILLQQVGVYLSAKLLISYGGGIFDVVANNNILYSADTLILWGSQNGTVVSLSFLFTLMAMMGAIALIVRWRINQVAATTYYRSQQFLAIKPFDWLIAIKVFMVFVVYSLIAELSLYLLDKDATAFLDEIYATAQPKWLLIIAIVIAAPIYEELMFRGVLWGALRQHLTGRMGFWITNFITSLLFAVIHVQYDLFELGVLLVFALLLGYTRERSGSLLLSMLLHALNNALAMLLYLMY